MYHKKNINIKYSKCPKISVVVDRVCKYIILTSNKYNYLLLNIIKFDILKIFIDTNQTCYMLL
jgi:hypothetical protein